MNDVFVCYRTALSLVQDPTHFWEIWVAVLFVHHYFVSWRRISCCILRFSFIIAFLLLLTGAALNDQHGGGTMYFGNYYYYCYVVKPGVFAGGAILSLASVLLAIVYYLTLNLAKNNSPLWGNPAPSQGIALGQPQFPPQNTQQPVFVHEDTYVRRQYAWFVTGHQANVFELVNLWRYESTCCVCQ